MSNLLIDAGVLAVPTSEAAHDHVYSYIEVLLDCGKMMDESWITLYMSYEARDALFQNNLYPIRPNLKQLFAEKGIFEVDANTVALVADRLIDKALSFEDNFGVTEVLTTDFATSPDVLGLYAPRCLSVHLERCLILVAVLRSHSQESAVQHILVRNTCEGASEIAVKACIHDIEFLRTDIDEPPKSPDYFKGSVLVCRNFRELVSPLDEVTMWESAHNDPSIVEAAVKVALYKSRLERGLNPTWEDLPPFSFGTEFLEHVDQCCAANPQSLLSRVIRALVETLDDLALTDVHALRTTEGGSAPQKTRRGDKAFRRDIDNEYRLHYWNCQDNTVEFASIGPHNDFSIPE